MQKLHAVVDYHLVYNFSKYFLLIHIIKFLILKKTVIINNSLNIHLF